MNWSDNELSDVMQRGVAASPVGISVPVLPASTLKAMMTRVVELVAARGGTMTEERLWETRVAWVGREGEDEMDDLLDHIAVLGARNATIETELAQWKLGSEVSYPTTKALQDALRQEVEHRRRLEADLEIAKRKRPASFEMEKELETALGERDDYRQKMLSECGKFMAEMQRADRLADEVKSLKEELAQWKRGSEISFHENKTLQTALQQEGEHRRILEAEFQTEKRLHDGTRKMFQEERRLLEQGRMELQTMADLRDGYRMAGALEHDRAEKAERQMESIRRRASEHANLERLIAEKGLPAAMQWIVDGECAGDACDGLTCESEPQKPDHDDAANPGHAERVKALSGVLAQSSQEPLSVVRAFLGDGEAPCSCAGTVDGDPGCTYCNLKEEARAALEKLSEAEYAKGHDAGAEAMRAACWEAVQGELERLGYGDSRDRMNRRIKSAIEGAAP